MAILFIDAMVTGGVVVGTLFILVLVDLLAGWKLLEMVAERGNSVANRGNSVADRGKSKLWWLPGGKRVAAKGRFLPNAALTAY